ncbi:molybdopterin oxidoreductase family protein [Dehalobacter sp. 4CP]|uniref:molybdopterin oxidoreductase family protein n=1 Tax=Dehalobacter sp. CP TaxID=2594474 RepID=UPI0039E88D66
MGALPNVYSGYQSVTSDEVRAKHEQAWVVPLSDTLGLKIPEMFEVAHEGRSKAMYILGENPALTDPNANHIKEALAKLDFLVVQELFMTETAEFADVVLPGASYAETDGTFTNTERRVQRVRKAIEPLAGQADWKTICGMVSRMGYLPELTTTAWKLNLCSGRFCIRSIRGRLTCMPGSLREGRDYSSLPSISHPVNCLTRNTQYCCVPAGFFSTTMSLRKIRLGSKVFGARK